MVDREEEGGLLGAFWEGRMEEGELFFAGF